MKFERRFLFAILPLSIALHAESMQERGKRVVQECLDALGGDRFMAIQNREVSGRAYSFYREQLSGLSVAKIYTRFYPGVKDTAHDLAVRERQNFGKKEDYGTLFKEKDAFNISFRGAQPLPEDRFERYKDTTRSDIFYILRIRMHEPLILESRGADVLQNAPVEIVDITDGDNRTTTVYFHQITKLPVREVFYRRNPVTKDKDEEITLFSKYRNVDGIQYPFAIERQRNGEKTFEIFADAVKFNDPKMADNLFELPADIKMLKRE
ncbi:MAG TPA: hypothetical protein VKT81_14485 [Bryobacteraceae bacterium]|nr:hypothetical protein [Bryobacteraceae bacterium]